MNMNKTSTKHRPTEILTEVVWGKTYKQAIVKVINEQRRYFDNEVKKAREEYGNL